MRTKPYTATGIRRAKCVRCKAPAFHDFRICAMGPDNRWPVCRICDVVINELVVRKIWGREHDDKLAAYREANLP